MKYIKRLNFDNWNDYDNINEVKYVRNIDDLDDTTNGNPNYAFKIKRTFDIDYYKELYGYFINNKTTSLYKEELFNFMLSQTKHAIIEDDEYRKGTDYQVQNGGMIRIHDALPLFIDDFYIYVNVKKIRNEINVRSAVGFDKNLNFHKNNYLGYLDEWMENK